MPSRYYFLSSLPMLRFSVGAPVSWDEFISSARGNVSDSDLLLLQAIGEDSADSAAEPFLRKWSAVNRAVSDAIKAAGTARVVYAAADPNPANRG